MPNRIIRDVGLTSRKLAAISDFGERLYWRVYQAVDDFGRFHADPALVLGRCFPLMMDKLKLPRLQGGLAELASVGLIVIYSVNGDDILQITKFDQRVRAARSKFPPPDDSQVTAVCQSPAAVVVVEEVGSKAKAILPTSAPQPGAGRESFERFWIQYPKKRSKGDALKAWSALKPTAGQVDRILASLERMKVCGDWTREGGKFIPYPATWLRATGWEDEPETATTSPAESDSVRRFREDNRKAMDDARRMYGSAGEKPEAN